MKEALYEIFVPHATNDGARLYVAERREFERRILDIAGGYTEMGPRRGVWRDPNGGRIYSEPMYAYRVMCDNATMGALLGDAFELFPDQVAIFISQLGHAEVVARHRQPA